MNNLKSKYIDRGGNAFMGVELLKNQLRINHCIQEIENYAVFENDIIVTDSKPDIKDILCADGEIFLQSLEIKQNKAVIDGNIIYKVIYMSDEEMSQSKGLLSSTDISHMIDVQEIENGTANLYCEIEKIECLIVNSRKVSLKATVRIYGKIYEERYEDVAFDVQGQEDEMIETKKMTSEFNEFSGREEDLVIITEKIVIPDNKPEIGDILDTNIKIDFCKGSIEEGRIAADAKLKMNTLYKSLLDDKIMTFESDIVFMREIDIAGIENGDIFNVDVKIVNGKFTIEEDSDGERREIDLEIAVRICAEAYKKKQIDILDDVYCLTKNISAERQVVDVNNVLAENVFPINIREMISVDENKPGCEEIFDVKVSPRITEYNIYEEQIEVIGICKMNIIYIGENKEQPVCFISQEKEFRQVFDVKGVYDITGCEIDAKISDLNFFTRGTRDIDIMFNVNVKARITKKLEIPVINKISESEFPDNLKGKRPGIVIYFVQSGDSLWEIAKKYRTTVDNILRANPNLEENGNLINIGQQILIPKVS